VPKEKGAGVDGAGFPKENAGCDVAAGFTNGSGVESEGEFIIIGESFLDGVDSDGGCVVVGVEAPKGVVAGVLEPPKEKVDDAGCALFPKVKFEAGAVVFSFG
jgi:hypothetical protein